MNGEIYNHDALRRHLEARGETFRTRCDGEVLAALLEREGPEGSSKAEGSYAFAFLGARRPAAPRARPAGVRPLAWARTPGGLVFASTVDALLATGLVSRRPDLHAVARRPARRRRLRHAVGARRRARARARRGPEVGADLSVRVTRVPAARPSARPTPRAIPKAACSTRCGPRSGPPRASTGPSGVFLSGGIDSALVASFARDQGRRAARTR